MNLRLDLYSAAVAILLGTVPAFSAPFPASKPGNGQAFDFKKWREEAAKTDFATHNRNHPGPHGGWFSPEDDNCAKNYHITWGPLGIRTLMHDHTWGALPAFRRAWPKCLLDSKGELILDCFEVVHVIPGSPADGHLQQGDLLVAMDGGLFRTAKALRPDQAEWQHQGSRSLELDAGERLDLAEGRGHISFDVIRPGAAAPEPITAALVREIQISEEIPQKTGTEIELDIPVVEGQEFTLELETTRGGNGSCGADLIRPRLEGAGGKLDLTNYRRIAEKTGWASIRPGTSKYKGADVAESIWFHAPGHLTWVVPKGFRNFRATLVTNAAAAGFRVRATTRATPGTLPPQLEKLHQVAAFDIPKTGSFGRGFPNNNDSKSALVARMTAAWLADQQQPDGSWQRNVGYTHRGYDTAWAGLGLLSQGDPAYDGHIRKAAEFIAFHCPQDHWATPAAVMVMFLSEYWLRTGDDRILTPLAGQVDRMRAEMIYGDFTSGHGKTPGYRGTGVSIGGSHCALAFALAELTPAKPENGLVMKMLDRAQELGPDGYIPYGRGTGTRSFEPNLTDGGTYSGRHGPYLIASKIHGGPYLFTRNCGDIYAKGPVGGIDQGHACQSLSTTWGLLASAITSPAALERQMAALRWKLTMLRCHDGGFGWNAYRLEYQGGEGLLPPYLRSGALLVVLNSPKHNLALTGAPKYRAKDFPNLPPLCHNDAVALSYYQRNWGVAAAVLGADAPESLKSGLTRLMATTKSQDTRAGLYGFLKSGAASAARDILAMKSGDPLTRQYLAEMVLGSDLRLAVEPETADEKPTPGKWSVVLEVQHPLAGYFEGAGPEERAAWVKAPPLPMSGTLQILDAATRKELLEKPLSFGPGCGSNGWQTQELKSGFPFGSTAGPLALLARFQYRVGDMLFAYDRPITAGADEPGSGEKGRKLAGDRVVRVKGRLAQSLGGWNTSFILPSGQFVSAAGQGGAVRVNRRHESWIAPEDGAVPAGAECEFAFTSGWQYYEARLGVISLLGEPHEVVPSAITSNGTALDSAVLMDYDRTTAAKAAGSMVEVTLKTPTPVQAVDLRLKNMSNDQRVQIETVQADGSWKIVWTGATGDALRSFTPVKTQRLRITVDTPSGKVSGPEITELRVIRAEN